jgi:uncharacterized protein (TIGR02646 family)
VIRLRRPAEAEVLDERTRNYLAKQQEAAHAYVGVSAEIDKAWAKFLRTKTRKKVAQALDTWTFAKCAYCEQVAAKDIEHFHPKASHPDRMFQWTNFLRGCKNCNNAKRDRFPLRDGQPLLIDPCSEEPLDFFLWDHASGRMALCPDEPHHARAAATRNLFDLDQEPLREERRQKLHDVLYLLAQAVEEEPLSEKTCERLQAHLQPYRPWLGIVRQLFLKPGMYARLVEAALDKVPEIRQWMKDWL